MLMKKIQAKNNVNEGVESMNNNVQEINIKEEVPKEEIATEVREDISRTVTKDYDNVVEVVMNAIPFSAKNVVRAVARKGGFSIVKAKTGNRTALAREGHEYLGKPKTLQYAFTDTSVLMGEKLPNNCTHFNVKETNGKAIVYSTALVKEIAERFELNFEDRTSMTFGDVQYTQNGNEPVIIVKIR